MDDNTEILLGNTAVRRRTQPVTGERLLHEGESWYRISGYDRMDPFFISVVSGYDHWMFVSSTGGLTCGRRNPDHALFPYETDDRIHDAHATAGPLTVLRVHRDGRTHLWEPFRRETGVYRLERHLYKNAVGNRLRFEEINRDLGLAFDYEWSCGDRFGFIRRARLRNLGDPAVNVDVLDGLRNVLPAGVTRFLQSTRSTLIDAYRQAELHEPSGAAVFTLSSIPTDRAEPSEALKATVAWQTGLGNPRPLLSQDQVEDFRCGQAPWTEDRRLGQRADYLVSATLDLSSGEDRSWYLVADVDLGQAHVVALLKDIGAGIDPAELERDIEHGSTRLQALVGAADGFQQTGDALKAARHFSNTLFNIMRGGVFPDALTLPRDDFLDFVRTWNHHAVAPFERLLAELGEGATRADLVAAVARDGSPDQQRLVMEYLPLTFSRRHGDPSRPWNHFDINLRDEQGHDRLFYEGNWRDIFQNWEALAHSFPSYIESFVARFVNASTPDGYNPYRINRDGIDWEVLEPDDPWSNIGYWGDHQVTYLQKLLELSVAYHPGELQALLDREIFVFADVPYRIRGYEAMLANPYDTVDYDEPRARRIVERVARKGADGRLVSLADGTIHRVNLLEKLLIVALVRLGNLVPGGGIWMNTQRPEWNDANNALVGHGLSMVTLCHLRRFLVFLDTLLAESPQADFRLSREVLAFFEDIEPAYASPPGVGDPAFGDAERKGFVDATGLAGQAFRERIYDGFSGARADLETSRIRALLQAATRVLDDTISGYRREDGLFHAYNLLAPGAEGFAVDHLPVMLEGQVAVLASGALGAEASLELLDALRASDLYRADQNSYLLYPQDRLPGFLDKNRIDPDRAQADPWIRQEIEAGRTDFFEQDADGQVRFNGRFRNGCEFRLALEKERSVDRDTGQRLGALFEEVFNHRDFTGRSGTMYKYEGLGCIYWHMVSKLLLEVGELLERHRDGPEAFTDALLAHYRQIESGLGVHKSPADYGAFPTDPYSHTPAFAGVQQPGMTGQVKEDIISRLGELGVRIENGCVRFSPSYLAREEFIAEAQEWTRPPGSTGGLEHLPPNTLGFFLCGIQVIYRVAEKARIHLHHGNDETLSLEGDRLDPAWSLTLLGREKKIRRIEVDVPHSNLR